MSLRDAGKVVLVLVVVAVVAVAVVVAVVVAAAVLAVVTVWGDRDGGCGGKPCSLSRKDASVVVCNRFATEI